MLIESSNILCNSIPTVQGTLQWAVVDSSTLEDLKHVEIATYI